MQSRTLTKKSDTFMGFLLVAFAVFLLVDVVQATYKKPPFNGSIFGKRANSITDYDTAGRTLSSLCEVAVEACSFWFPQLEAKK
ncbi:hypothetical protein RUM44_006234 [Polyplax serrata]